MSLIQMEGCTFVNCHFVDVLFNKVDILKCEFKNTNFTRTEMRASRLSQCSLVNCIIKEATFQKTDMASTVFDLSLLKQTRFEELDLRQAKFPQCDFSELDVTKATFDQEAMIELSPEELKKVRLNETAWAALQELYPLFRPSIAID